MLESFCRHVDGPVLVIVRDATSVLRIPDDLRDRTRVVVAPDLLYGPLRRHVRAVAALAGDLAAARSFSVIGADVMDGVYSVRSSMRRFQLAELLGRAGKDSRVLGFSWNSSPHPRAVAAMRACRSATLCARDPDSAARLKADGGRKVVDVADLAFLPGPRETLPPQVEEWLTLRPDSRVILLNANYLLEDRIDQVSALTSVIERWSQPDVSFVLLSHDSRSMASDGVLAQQISERVGQPEQVLVVPGILNPGAVRTLCARAEFVVTGRMHLAILAAVVSTPAIATSYQGKLRGLYARLGLESLVEPDADFAQSVHSHVANMMHDIDRASSTITANLPSLLELAARNLPKS
ncbi:polysaccharide pyruvyl transferase family protein [Modestobacter sp. VKM Ac-2984]|uniref:polysaccharide pyruvyl transferase family protein n=1 Tax=Modestobacter sp. VKM Ac-2984 TaxID=3004138 RepID=UPI0022AA8AC4|nr:polysaccharide pyruvyl transferase family protein [Modestobacter sp. VKM Ac-2984]MCZ2817362.1 polysaccharide pyruvyl transferase family protein [Modestobacter sp. VKM Ac-2984]